MNGKLWAAFKHICLLSLFSHWGAECFLSSVFKERQPEATGNILKSAGVSGVYVGGCSKGHSECISGLSCAMCQGDSAERNHKKGSAEGPALHVPQRRQIPPQGPFIGFTSETREP